MPIKIGFGLVPYLPLLYTIIPNDMKQHKMQYPRRYVSSHVTQLNAKARSITRAIL